MGRASAFDEFAGHVPSLRRYARHLTRCTERADDLVQECLMRAIRSADTLRPGGPIRPWLFRILHNLHVSEQRRERVRAADHKDFAEEAVSAAQYEQLELRSVLEAVARLPEGQRQAICLVALEDLTYAEAAQVLDIPLGTLMSRLARGREALRQLMDGKSPKQLYVVGGSNAG